MPCSALQLRKMQACISRPKTERLISNLLKVASYSQDLHIAQTEIKNQKQLWAIAKESKRKISSEFCISNGNLMSFHDLSVDPWPEFCDAGTH